MAFTIEFEGDGGEEILEQAVSLCAARAYVVQLDVLDAQRVPKAADYVIVDTDAGDLLVNEYHEHPVLGEGFVQRGGNRRIPLADVVGIKIY